MSTKIFVGNLGDDVSPDDVRPVFEEYGTVEECDVLKNYGFVHMSDEKEAKEAVSNLHGTNMKGQRMRVELSTGKRGGAKGDRRGGYGRDREGGRPRPYPPGPPRRGPPPPDYDPYYRYPYERDPFYRLPPIDRYPYPPRLPPMDDRYPYPPLRRERLYPEDRYLDPRDRLMVRERLLYDDPYYDRLRALERDPYYRERSPLGARPPPEYYDRKAAMRGPPESSDNPPSSHASSTAYPPSNGQDLYRRPAAEAPQRAAGAYGAPPPAPVAGAGQLIKNGPAGPVRPPAPGYNHQVPPQGQQQQQQYPGQQFQQQQYPGQQQQYPGQQYQQQYPGRAPAGAGSYGMQHQQ